jgi:RNA polymerase-binding transcription factor
MDSDRARQLLNAERARIVASLAQLRHADTASRTTTSTRRRTLARELTRTSSTNLADDRRRQLAAVERAEQRLAAGTYGFSIKNGRTIADERLEGDPTTERTTAEEKRQRASSVRRRT